MNHLVPGMLSLAARATDLEERVPGTTEEKRERKTCHLHFCLTGFQLSLVCLNVNIPRQCGFGSTFRAINSRRS